MIYTPKNPCEKFHIKICKQILGVNQKSSNLSALVELGRFRISIKIFKLTYKYIISGLNIDNMSLASLSIKTPDNSYMILPKLINRNIKHTFYTSKENISKNKLANETEKV